MSLSFLFLGKHAAKQKGNVTEPKKFFGSFSFEADLQTCKENFRPHIFFIQEHPKLNLWAISDFQLDWKYVI